MTESWAETRFICGNCEDDFTGFPAGCRPGDGRPLCARCTDELVPSKRVHERPAAVVQRFDGLITFGYMMGALILIVVTFTMFLLCRDRH